MIPQSEYIREEHAILAIRNSLGNVEFAAKELGLSKNQLFDYMLKHPAVSEERERVRKMFIESAKDKAEEILVSKMETDNALLMFFLRTQGADRGYGSNSGLTVTGKNGGPIQVNLNARTLIAAMRDGMYNGSESDNQDSNLLEE